MSYALKAAGALAALTAGFALLFTFERPPIDTVQLGYRGLAQQQPVNPRTELIVAAKNVIPAWCRMSARSGRRPARSTRTCRCWATSPSPSSPGRWRR